MKKVFVLFFFIALYSNSYAVETKNDYFLQINYEQKQVNIPLKILDQKTIRPPKNPEDNFIKVDGMYCSKSGMYLEGLCRFEDKYGNKWELKFCSEKLLNKKYSILSIIIICENKVKQQNDFSFKGDPIDMLTSEVAPFSIIGLSTKQDEWFSITLIIKNI